MSERREPEIDIPAIREDAKARWKQQYQSGESLLERIESSVPLWLIIVALVMFALSAPHTAETFGRLTPVFGYLAPFAVEFGLLYGAFRRKRSQQKGQRAPKTIYILEGLLFITAIIVNGAGSLAAVVPAVGVQDMSFDSIIGRYGTFPITTQVALLLIPVAALIIPIGTSVCGEGVATLISEWNKSKQDVEHEWQKVEFNILREAFFEAYLQEGLRPSDARRLAANIAAGFIDQEAPGTVFSVTNDTKRRDDTQRISPKTDRAKRLLSDNPGWQDKSTRELEAETGISRNVWSEVKREFSSNGNGRSHSFDKPPDQS